ncbi:hypothetical protein NM208_g3811 [Fusarium decemcellulare]|uniref:Uncharacterized protein n=1 Tax=Fusarium decemcellulare TaxID=57161 RepID=A0ACC1SMY6_9HYPO|nr:hypothetical protein NM208_g3811 [Fusarium decemcellulare]
MKFSTIATLLFAIGTSAAPEPDNAVIKEGEYTYTGIDKPLLTLRGLEARCDCFPCYSPHADCSPGKCQLPARPWLRTVLDLSLQPPRGWNMVDDVCLKTRDKLLVMLQFTHEAISQVTSLRSGDNPEAQAVLRT